MRAGIWTAFMKSFLHLDLKKSVDRRVLEWHTKLASREWYHNTKLLFFSLSVSNGRPRNGACKLDPLSRCRCCLEDVPCAMATAALPWERASHPKVWWCHRESRSQHCVRRRQPEPPGPLIFTRVFSPAEAFFPFPSHLYLSFQIPTFKDYFIGLYLAQLEEILLFISSSSFFPVLSIFSH